jgi:hypothetical protein
MTKHITTTAIVAVLLCGLLSAQANAQPVIPGKSISGTVTEDPGSRDMIRLLGGVDVRLYMEDTGGGPIVWIWPVYTLVDSTKSDAFGRYAFARRGAGSYEVAFADSGYQTRTIFLTLAQDTILNVALLPDSATGTITGTITEACATGTTCLWNPPVPGCTVTVFIERMMCAYMVEALTKTAAGPIQWQAVTDAQGRFTISGVSVEYLDPGPCRGIAYVIQVQKQGFQSGTQGFVPLYDQSVTVDAQIQRLTTAVGPQRAVNKGRALVLSKDGRVLELNLVRAQNVSVTAFDLTGRQVSEASFSRPLPAGHSELTLGRAAARGVCLVRVAGEGFAETIRLTSARP